MRLPRGPPRRAAPPVRAPEGEAHAGIPPDVHRRAEPRRDLRAGGPGVLARLPHHGPGQLLARQRGHDRRLHRRRRSTCPPSCRSRWPCSSRSPSPAAIGIIIERVLRPLENKDFDLMLIGTIGFGIVLEALAIMIWGATGQAVPSPVPAAPHRPRRASADPHLRPAGAGDRRGGRCRCWCCSCSAPSAGAAMQAVAMDHEAATAVGIHVGRSNAIAFASAPASPRWPAGWSARCCTSARAMGGSLGIKGFAAAILGGFGSIPGAIVGGLAIGVLDSLRRRALPGLLRTGHVPGLHRDHHGPARPASSARGR